MNPPAPAERAAAEEALRGLRPVLSAAGLALGIAREGSAAARPLGVERSLAAAMHPRRRRTFLAGRCAARRALRLAGRPPAQIGYEEAGGGRPAFPPGSVGSLSHSGGLAVAVAADPRDHAALGCDLELNPLPLKGARLILNAGEEHLLPLRDSDSREAEGRLLALFSAKEAAFKVFSALLAAEAPTTLSGITLRTAPEGFLATASRPPPDPPLLVHSIAAGRGVFSWAAAPAR